MLNILQKIIMALPQLGATVVDSINTYTITLKPIQIELHFKSKHTIASVRITTPIHERSFTADHDDQYTTASGYLIYLAKHVDCIISAETNP